MHYNTQPRHSHQFKISERYQPEFGSKRVDLTLLISEIRDMLKTKDISLDALKSFLGLFHQLRDAVLSITSIEEAINVVCDHTSLINTNYLLAIAKKFKLQDAIALINQYDDSIDEFCQKIPIVHTYGQEFMLHSSRHLQKSEKVEFVLEWDDDDKTLTDVQGLLRNAFHEHAEYVMVIKISPTKSISVICYAPPHLHKELVKVVRANEEHLRKVKVLSVAIGLQEVLKREPDLKVRMSVHADLTLN